MVQTEGWWFLEMPDWLYDAAGPDSYDAELASAPTDSPDLLMERAQNLWREYRKRQREGKGYSIVDEDPPLPDLGECLQAVLAGNTASVARWVAAGGNPIPPQDDVSAAAQAALTMHEDSAERARIARYKAERKAKEAENAKAE